MSAATQSTQLHTSTQPPAVRQTPDSSRHNTPAGTPSGLMALSRRQRFYFVGLPTLTVVALLLGFLFFFLGSLTNQAEASGEQAPGVTAETVTVQNGESLWNVAASLDSGTDIQVLIDQIAELNGLESSTLQPGQTLYVPAAD